MASIIDEDSLTCKFCGHEGMILDGDCDVQCPACDAEYSLGNESDEVEEQEEF